MENVNSLNSEVKTQEAAEVKHMLKNSPNIFARKFDCKVDMEIIKEIEKITNPKPQYVVTDKK